MIAVYARVSTDEQVKTGYSLPSQIDACRKKLGNAEIQEYIDDGYSGEFLDRPALSKLRDDLRASKISVVLVYDPDRLSRNLTNQLIIADEIEKFGAKLDFVTGSFDSSPEGKLFFSMRGAIAEYEKAKIRERTNRGKRSKALGGKLTFQDKPFGYAPDKENFNYTIIEDEAEVVRTIFNLLLENKYGLRSLRLDLTSRGIMTRAGKPFSLNVLRAMIRNPMYAGTKMAFRVKYKIVGPRKPGKKRPQFKETRQDESEWVPIPVPAIVSRETWEQAQIVLDNNQRFSRRNTKSEYLVRNIIRCDCCGYAMTANKHFNHGKYVYYYTCQSKSEGRPCDNRYIPAQQLDAEVWDYIYNAAKTKKLSNILTPKNNTSQQYLRKQLSSLEERQTYIVGLIAEGRINRPVAEKNLDKLAKEIVAVNAAIAAAKPQSPSPRLSPEKILRALTFEQKREAILDLNIKVIARRNKAGELGWYLDW